MFEYSSYLKLKDLKKESSGQESVDGSDKQETFKLLGKLIKKRALLTAGCKIVETDHLEERSNYPGDAQVTGAFNKIQNREANRIRACLHGRTNGFEVFEPSSTVCGLTKMVMK